MILFLLGLAGFFALHSLRVVAPRWRAGRIAAWGEGPWKGIYSLLSIAFFVMLVWGYGQVRQAPTLLWLPPPALRHVGMLITLIALVLLVAAYVPRNHLRRLTGHPMTLAIAIWAVAHLLMTGWLHSVLLAVAMLVWALMVFFDARRRPVAAPPAASSALSSIVTIALGVAVWAGFAFDLHRRLIGVALF
jgi:uncharacterized membrane protein